MVSDAAAVAIRGGRAGPALEMLEHERGLLISNALDARGDLHPVADAALAARLREIGKLLAASSDSHAAPAPGQVSAADRRYD